MCYGAAMSEINSPCIRNCCLDTDDICLGCFRHIEEIMIWSNMSTTTEQKQQIINNAHERKQTRHTNNE